MLTLIKYLSSYYWNWWDDFSSSFGSYGESANRSSDIKLNFISRIHPSSRDVLSFYVLLHCLLAFHLGPLHRCSWEGLPAVSFPMLSLPGFEAEVMSAAPAIPLFFSLKSSVWSLHDFLRKWLVEFSGAAVRAWKSLLEGYKNGFIFLVDIGPFFLLLTDWAHFVFLLFQFRSHICHIPFLLAAGLMVKSSWPPNVRQKHAGVLLPRASCLGARSPEALCTPLLLYSLPLAIWVYLPTSVVLVTSCVSRRVPDKTQDTQ